MGRYSQTSEGDLFPGSGDTFVECRFEKPDHLFDTRGETGGEDISVRVIQPHGTVEIIGCRLETLQFAACLYQLSPFFNDQLEVFDLEDALDQRHLLFKFRSRWNGFFLFSHRCRSCRDLFGFMASVAVSVATD